MFVACLIMFIPSELCLEFKQDVRQNRDRTTHFRAFFVLFCFFEPTRGMTSVQQPPVAKREIAQIFEDPEGWFVVRTERLCYYF